MAKLKDIISRDTRNDLLRVKNDLKIAEISQRETLEKDIEKKERGVVKGNSAAIYSYVGLMLFGKGDEEV